MAIVAGSVTVASDGTYSGSGLALELFEAEVDARADWIAYLATEGVNVIVPTGDRLWRTMAALRCAALAAVFAAHDNIRIAANALDAGVPSVERVLTGAVE